MNIENTAVRHIAFGNGIVTAFDGKYITVKFNESGVEKRFVYPDAFEKFLTLADGTVSDEIMSDLSVANDKKAKILAEKNAENMRSMTHGIVIPGKEGPTDPDDEESGYKNSQEND